MVMRATSCVGLGLAVLLGGTVGAHAARLAPAPEPGSKRELPTMPGVTGDLDLGVPAFTGPVVDRAGVISETGARRIEALAFELKRKTGAELAVLTVDTVAPLDPFDYGQRVADTWRLGQAGKDNGLLLLVVVRERQVRFFTGYGLEGILPDGRLGAILDEQVTPRFRTGDYEGGIYAGLRTAAEVVATDAGVELSGKPEAVAPRGPADDLLPLLLLLGFFLLTVYVASSRRRRRRFYPIFFGGGMSGGFGGGFGGFGGGGFSGGGGFGGGGRFGGGGAGRGW